ncbi:MAG: hypothetical protein WA705_08905 [Candidatus Ozemobacteraceae bacterium]
MCARTVGKEKSDIQSREQVLGRSAGRGHNQDGSTCLQARHGGCEAPPPRQAFGSLRGFVELTLTRVKYYPLTLGKMLIWNNAQETAVANESMNFLLGEGFQT